MIHSWLARLFGQDQQQFGAIRLTDHKALSNQHGAKTIRPVAGDKLTLPLQQHLGDKPELVVEIGDYVYKGE